ncbi:hypothetical protein [Actinokineospora globicatena]|uniref:Uncharacterized protein n=1 Tax=Actinokineospora globicatena TaxID=103729 RepID=A0A9W6QHY5_9PSEU|nr:hypothetical protein [Actinokineospora globicatena]MCP2303121.1 hypothetical protein [Actinokineospora globicatena]GLW79765.1 hypothetical protein Aglo01_42460 [Actinokineospora globicatena]GLW85825.1 hypothetical protein Aglo02_34650 [Actinokineospora globicatena]GLW90371.1 hypothetical protein Aglo03_11870 [Actinokineospora globicatena]
MTSPYEHLFVRKMPNCLDDLVNEGAGSGVVEPPNIGEALALMRSQEVPESKIHLTYCWITECDSPVEWVKEHVHDYDEVLIWHGNDPTDPDHLGAEIYFDIEGVRHTVTTSGSVYIPAGVRHCPLGFTRVDRPFRFSALSLSPNYASADKTA